MKTAREFWVEKYGRSSNDSDKLAIAMMAEYGDYIKGQQPQPHTFPTWEEFDKWCGMIKNSVEIYDFFRNRIQPLELRKDYEFSDDGKDWVHDNFRGYLGKNDDWIHIRPIQRPEMSKSEVVEKLRSYNAWRRDDYGTHEQPTPTELGKVIDDAIKMLEATP